MNINNKLIDINLMLFKINKIIILYIINNDIIMLNIKMENLLIDNKLIFYLKLNLKDFNIHFNMDFY